MVTARRQYLMVLTDRRLLLFTRRRRRALRASDLVIGKRYEAFSLSRVRKSLPLYSVRVEANNGTRMVFEFRPGQRHLGGALVARLTPAPAVSAPPPAAPALAGRAWPAQAHRTDATEPIDVTAPTMPTRRTDPTDPAGDEQTFWGPSTRGA